MYSVEVPKIVNSIISTYYRLGLWSRGNEATVRETRIKLVYSIFHLFFPLSVFAGAYITDNKDESIFSIEMALDAVVLLVKLCYILWNKEEILKLIDLIGFYSIDDREQFTLANKKLQGFNKIAIILILIICLTCASAGLIVPFLGSEKNLFFNIVFPFDWKNDDIAFWMAFTFLNLEIFISLIAFLFSVLTWYLMISCAIRYEILGRQIVNMGERKSVTKRKISKVEKENLFRRDLVAAIDSNLQIKESTNQVCSFLSNVFLVQMVTSGLCICGSIYCLVYNTSDNMVEFVINVVILFYNIFEIFLVMYFGNEIMLTSDRLSYSLFESSWIDQPQSTKKCIIIFGEMLRRPHTVVILKIYPITLETFTRILNSAYSMFNILKNFK